MRTKVFADMDKQFPHHRKSTAERNLTRENFHGLNPQAQSYSPQRQVQTGRQVFRTEVPETTNSHKQPDSQQTQEEGNELIFKTLGRRNTDSQTQQQASQAPLGRAQPHTQQTQEVKQQSRKHQTE